MGNITKPEPSGVLIVKKHAGVTSHDIVGMIRRLYGTRKVGHAGTLDPMATGVLVVLIGRAAKAAEYLQKDRKIYRAVLRLGIETDTEDITGKPFSSVSPESIPDADTVSEVCRRFVGETEQIPPMYSALKVGGRKLVDLAREGKTVERAARRITVYSLDVSPLALPFDYTLTIECSGGTYIRTLCADIGRMLGCGGVMAELERICACGYNIDMAHTIDDISAMDEEERLSLLLPVESLFDDLPAVCLPPFYERLCRAGCVIYQKKLGTSFNAGVRVRICNKEGHFFALGEVGEHEEGSAIKAVKQFELI